VRQIGHRTAECRAAAPRPKVLELCNDETALQGHYDARELQAPEAIATIQAVEQQDGVRDDAYRCCDLPSLQGPEHEVQSLEIPRWTLLLIDSGAYAQVCR
jgi:allophanate hydrolase subunit 1